MDSVLDQIGEWLKELLVSGIMNQLTGLFDSVNTQVGDIATQVGTTPANFSPGVFAMIRNVSESVIIPVAGFVFYDIKELGKQLKKLGMLIVQDQVWGRVTANRSAGKTTRYYMDEFHLLLKEEQTASYSVEIWKRFRKWGGIPTGITQNVKDLLSSREVENIFENSDFVYMLNQAAGDRQILAQQLNISPHQLSYGTTLFENVSVTNSSIWGFGKIGILLGMGADPGVKVTFKDCVSKNNTIHAAYDMGGLAGMIQRGNGVDNASVENCTVENITVDYYNKGTYVDVKGTATLKSNDQPSGSDVSKAIDGKYLDEAGYYWCAYGDYYVSYGHSSYDAPVEGYSKRLANSEYCVNK